MSLIQFDAGKCVRNLTKFSECNRCEVICPNESLQINSNLPAINHSLCVSCGGCVGVCPTEALSLDNFSTTTFFFDFAQSEDTLISCKKNVPCLSVLNVEHVIALCNVKKELVFDSGHCATCEIAHTCKKEIDIVVDEANYFLEASGSSSSVSLLDITYMPEESVADEINRRDMFKAINLSNAVKSKVEFEKEVQKASDELIEHSLAYTDIATLRAKHIPDKRKVLFSSLKYMEKPETFHIVDANEISFTSQKILDEDTCTACQMCYRVCPTGALSSDARNSKIDFDAFLCIKCHICHDVCEPDAITLSSSYNLKEVHEPSVKNLISYDVKRCDECGNVFTSIKGAKICYRCLVEEEEAKELWGISDF